MTTVPNSPKHEKVIFGTLDTGDILPIKVISDGGTPALGKLVTKLE